MTTADFTPEDREQLERQGIGPAEAERQLALLRAGGSPTRLLRPCTVGDGILRLDDSELAALCALHDEAAGAERMVKFVPASGAATRMFRELAQFQAGAGRAFSWTDIVDAAREGDGDARALVAFVDGRRRFAFHDALADCVARQDADLEGLVAAGAFQPILDALLDPEGLGYATLPKGLLWFHLDGRTPRTPFEEHLAEAAATIRDRTGVCRVHFTVSPDHLPRFERLLGEVTQGADPGARCDVSFSTQDPATDTLALDARGAPRRDARGRLVLRPSGHGALIGNLAALAAEVVFIKNIDNVQPEPSRGVTITWKKALGGLLVRTEREIAGHLARLGERDPSESAIDEADTFARERLGVAPGGRRQPTTYQCRRAFLIDRLNRPLRVAGVVRNTGEPGGGPFWVADGDSGASLQIVESAQVGEAPEQRRIFGAATHFNPVDLVCHVSDANGRPFDLARFVDPATSIVTRKSTDSGEAIVLERPGLWNGAMAGWNTLFVEVPIETFTPVKSVLDLLRPEHQ